MITNVSEECIISVFRVCDYLHGITAQKIAVDIFTAVRTSAPRYMKEFTGLSVLRFCAVTHLIAENGIAHFLVLVLPLWTGHSIK
jgi:hypothetical protein